MNPNLLRRRLTAALTFFTAACADAVVRLPRVIGSDMVLQRDVPVPIWGWAEPGKSVTCW